MAELIDGVSKIDLSKESKPKSKKRASNKNSALVASDENNIEAPVDSQTEEANAQTPKPVRKTRAKKATIVENIQPANSELPINDELAINAEKVYNIESTLVDLKNRCKQLGIKGYSKKNKAELLAIINTV